jgi:Na+/phosphate symporter
MKNKQNAVMALLEDCRLTQIRRIRSGEGSTRVNVIYMDIMGETKNILIYSYNLFQSICDFYRKSPEKAIR